MNWENQEKQQELTLQEENQHLKKLLTDYQNTNRKQDLELKLMMEQYQNVEVSLEKALEKVLDLEESIPLMIKDVKGNLKNWLNEIEKNLNEKSEKNKQNLIEENQKNLTKISTLISSVDKLDTQVKENISTLTTANDIVKTFKTDSSDLLKVINRKNTETLWSKLLKIGVISFVLNGCIISLFFWIGNANVNKQLILRDSIIYEKLMDIDRVQRGDAKFYFDKKDNALYIQDTKKKNAPKKLNPETTYLKGFWQSFWDRK